MYISNSVQDHKAKEPKKYLYIFNKQIEKWIEYKNKKNLPNLPIQSVKRLQKHLLYFILFSN